MSFLTKTGSAFNDFLVGGLPAATGRRMYFTGTTVLKVINGKMVEEIGLDDGVTALTQLGLIKMGVGTQLYCRPRMRGRLAVHSLPIAAWAYEFESKDRSARDKIWSHDECRRGRQ